MERERIGWGRLVLSFANGRFGSDKKASCDQIRNIPRSRLTICGYIKKMLKKCYDLAVAYRIYPKTSKSPLVFCDNKYKLAELCLKSFKEALGALKARIWVLLDNCPREYEDLFAKYFDRDDLELKKLNGIGNLATFNLQIDILSEQDFAEAVYFAEDDYFYLANQFERAVKFLLQNNDADFVSLYDHADYYALDLHKHRNYIKVFDDVHWRTANSTCLTFLTIKKTLNQTKSIFKSYVKRNSDASLWLSLTKYKLFNPLAMLKYAVRDRLLFKILAKAWFFGWKQNLFGKRWKLWTPIPALATHIESTHLSPAIDWLTLIKRTIKQMETLPSE
ncbi:MAG: hypothetical protein ACREAE_01115 [Nitrosopumilaceae archaeon]